MSDAAPQADAANLCAALVRQHDFSRYATTLFVLPVQRRALLALYAFNVEIVRVRDHITQPLAGEIRLQWWSDLLAGAGHGHAEGSPVAAELLDAVRAHDLPPAVLSRLIEEHQFDLYNDPMPTTLALDTYLDGTASALLRLSAQILGDRSEQAAHVARHAGIAVGMMDVIMTLPLDAARRQSFVPLDLLEAHGAQIEDLFAGRETPALRLAFADIVAQAQTHLDAALSQLASVSPAARPAFLQLAEVRRRLATARQAAWKMFTPAAPSRLRTLWTLWQASRSPPFRS